MTEIPACICNPADAAVGAFDSRCCTHAHMRRPQRPQLVVADGESPPAPPPAPAPLTSIRISDNHEWKLVDWNWRRDRLTWELHYLPTGSYIRPADRFEQQMLNAAKRLVDAARGVQEIG